MSSRVNIGTVPGRVSGRLQGLKGAIAILDETPRQGGLAEVYRGRDVLGQAVAVKVARESSEERRCLLSELEALKAIHARHPGSAAWLVPVLDEGTLADGRPFMVLPWFDHSLQSWLRARQPDLQRRLEALMLAGEAVVRLHRSASSLTGVVLHRDLKPSNLLVDEAAGGLRVVLADLGGVKERSYYGDTQNTGLHTPHYAPLEQALPLARPPDPSVDVHALAVLVYAVLVGRPPQAVMVRQVLLTDSAEELLRLHRVPGHRSASEEARYDELRRSPVSRMIDMEGAQALPDDDVRRLRDALVGLLADRGEAAPVLADDLVQALVPTLRHALELDPNRRLSQPAALLATIEAALQHNRAGQVTVQVEEVATVQPPVSLQTPTPPQERSPRRWVPGVALAALATLICSGTLVVQALPDPPAGQNDDVLPAVDGPEAHPEVKAISATGSEMSAVSLDVPGGSAGSPTPPARAPEPAGSAHAASTSGGEEQVVLAPLRSSDPPAPEITPTAIISNQYDYDADLVFNGRAVEKKSSYKQRLRVGRNSVTFVSKSKTASVERSFDVIVRAQDQESWSVEVEDRKYGEPSALVVASGGIIQVQWTDKGPIQMKLR